MKILCHILPSVLVLLLLAGCVGSTSECRIKPPPAGLEPVDGRIVVGVITAENRGAFLFGCLPLWSGYPYNPNRRDYKTFRNYMTEGYQLHMLKTAARKAKAELGPVETGEYDSWLYTLGLVWFRKLESRAVLLGPEAAHVNGYNNLRLKSRAVLLGPEAAHDR